MSDNTFGPMIFGETPYTADIANFDFDLDNTRYSEGARFETNKLVGFGTRRQFSRVRTDIGMTPSTNARLTLLDFVVTFHTRYQYQNKYHAAEIVLKGILSSLQVETILAGINSDDNDTGKAYTAIWATETLDGIPVTVEVVKLRRGKKTREIVYRNDNGLLEVRPAMKNWSNERKEYKRNRRNNW